jgi:glutathione S-transferase
MTSTIGGPSVPELFQFAFSHYNEKARWALDWKRVPHRRRSLLPGPHRPVVQKLTGQSQVPVLRWGDDVVAGSARIIDHVERRCPEQPLYPAPDAARTEALELARWFDDEVGGPIRLAFFHDVLRDSGYAVRSFTTTVGPVAAAAYRVVFPVIRVVMRRDMKIDAAGAERGIARTKEALDLVAKRAGADGYLVGDRFSVADLTAASLLSVAVFPKESPVTVVEPRSPVMTGWLERFAGDPGVAWVAEIYRRHRGASAEILERTAAV